MDGTLVSGHLSIAPETAEAVKFAQKQGIEFVVATGRNYQEASVPLKNAGIECGMITVNGAQVYDKNGETVTVVDIDKEAVAEILDIFEENNIYAEIATDKGIFSESHAQRIEYFASHIAEAIPHLTYKQALALASTRMEFFHITYVKSIREVAKRSDIRVLKLFVINPDGDKVLGPLSKEISEKIPDVVITSSGTYNIEINHKNAQKGIAVARLAHQLGIEQSEVMAIGDSFNDVSMLQYAGVSFAMGNAEQEIKEYAKYETDSNNDNGVGKAILKAINEDL